MKGMAILLAMTIAGAGSAVETEVAVETETETEAEVMSYTDEDLWYLSRVIQAESGYCEAEMQIGVGSVLINRVNSDLFPNSIKELLSDINRFVLDVT